MYTFLIMILSIEFFFILLKIYKITLGYMKLRNISSKISNNIISESDLSNLSPIELYNWSKSLFTSMGYLELKDLDDTYISILSKNNTSFAILCKHYIDENDFYKFIGSMHENNISNGYILSISSYDDIILDKLNMLPSNFDIKLLSSTDIINLMPNNFYKISSTI
ncbi:putative membrane protein [Clostridium bornimense]|uniref:Putative membrane protein n=1 Tax=Clostridium bornimense TaxID=1216932 RepID=W6RV80_9CLOT|nr:hypothetical protein [Clostridium bornimense]CDM68586.1 putative membrane protein [Clostridium bornimense]